MAVAALTGTCLVSVQPVAALPLALDNTSKPAPAFVEAPVTAAVPIAVPVQSAVQDGPPP
ncbi:MAG: hypothetical protein WCK64_01815 [Synechococcaceae cyanobacterium ELA445]